MALQYTCHQAVTPELINFSVKKFYGQRGIFVSVAGLDSNNMSENQVASSFSFKIFERIKPDEYFRRFIEENVRPDGRALHTFRPTSIRQGAITTANGSAMIRIGGTTVVCGIKAEVAEPRVDRPKDGYLGWLEFIQCGINHSTIVPNVELSPICSANFRPGPPSEQAQVNAEIINQVLIK
jgi:exosome complex component RRP43